MKIKIISLFFSLALIFLSTYESISMIVMAEKSSLKTVELMLEKKVSDNLLDDSHIVSFSQILSLYSEHSLHNFNKKIYTYNSTSILFRPPIFIS